MSKDEFIEVTTELVLLYSTARAYLFRTIPDEEEIWIPKSQVENIELGKDKFDEEGRPVREVVSLSIPEWLAEKHGLL